MRCDQAIFQVVISSSSLTLAARIPTAVLKLDLEPHGDLLDVEPRRVPVEADAPADIARFCLGELRAPALSEVSRIAYVDGTEARCRRRRMSEATARRMLGNAKGGRQ